jgi:hypothetical protein
MEEKLSQCFESLGRGESFLQIESCQPFKDIYTLNNVHLLSTGMVMGITLAVAVLVVVMEIMIRNDR